MIKHEQVMPRIKTLGEPGEEPDGYVCPVCGAIFRREGAMLRHERTHQRERARVPDARDDTLREMPRDRAFAA